MSDAQGTGFAAPPFKPEEALQQIKRALRDMKLNERGNGFDVRGKRVLELLPDATHTAGHITARIARKLALTPEWDTQKIATTTDQRKLLDEVKKRLARWDREE